MGAHHGEGLQGSRISRTFKNRGQEGKGVGLGVLGGSRAWGTELGKEAKPQAAPAQDRAQGLARSQYPHLDGPALAEWRLGGGGAGPHHRVLRQVVVRPPRDGVELHQVLEVGDLSLHPFLGSKDMR